jgi:iron complex outermembrane receptor protein
VRRIKRAHFQPSCLRKKEFRRRPWTRTLLIAVLGLCCVDHPASAADSIDPFALSPEQLFGATVESVTRMPEKLNEAPAAIYVITREDIRRSGATRVPEMLRLAPNLQVARDSALGYAISARGFNSSPSNKLLVLIDGRSVYTPLYSGEFWDSVNVLPDDIERIEVISGPGATLWGSNAVNGVINILTRNSRDTKGAVLSVTGGNLEDSVAARYGGSLSDKASFRLYAMASRLGNTLTAAGTDPNDSWNNPQGGFRVDWSGSSDAITFQGDAFGGTASSDVKVTGRNLLARWNRSFENGSALQVQTYYDHTSRRAPNGLGDVVEAYDLDLLHSFLLGDRHSINWGGGYRVTRDQFFNTATGAFIFPTGRTLNLGNFFLQDSFSVTDSLKLIGGIKFETNSYTDMAIMPSVRSTWNVTDTDMLWAAVSRAARTPARFDRDVFQKSGAITTIAGGPNFQDEILTAYEIGYRTESFARASLSVSAYYNVYDDLRTIELSPTGTIPISFAGRSGFLPGMFKNGMEGNVYGVEIWGIYSVTDWWRLTAGFNALHEDLRLKPGSLDIMGLAAAGNDPTNQFSLRSSMNLDHDVEWDIGLRGVSELPNPKVPGYFELETRLGWHVTQNFEVSIAGFNLLDEQHPEFGVAPQRGELRRSFTVNSRWKF